MISLKGKTLSGNLISLNDIISLDFESSLSVPCDSLKVKLPLCCENEEFSYLFAYEGNVCFFEGGVDCQKILKSKDGMFLILEARSRAAALLDNEALPYTYFGMNSALVFTKFAKPCGVLYSELPSGKKISELQVEKGSSIWSVIESFCTAAFKKHPYLTRDMVLTVNPITSKEHVISEKENPFMKSALILRRDKQISKLMSKTGKTPGGNHYGVQLTNSIARGKEIRRERYYHPGKEDKSIIAAESERIIHDSNREGFALELTLPYIKDVRAGDGIRFIGGKTYSGLYIDEMAYHIGKDGIFTELLCRDKRFV